MEKMTKAVLMLALTLTIAVALFTSRVSVHRVNIDGNTGAKIIQEKQTPSEPGDGEMAAATAQDNDDEDDDGNNDNKPAKKTTATATRASRFLAQYDDHERNPRAASQCRKDSYKCMTGGYAAAGRTTCCKNKCVNLRSDDDNCGRCGKKCNFMQACCRGQCVFLAYDKRHCGGCNNKCRDGQYCIYGMCDYA